MNFLDDPQGAQAALDQLLRGGGKGGGKWEELYGGLSPFDLDNFELLFSEGRSTWFTAQLIRLVAKADQYNRERIRAGFPAEVAAFERWHATGDPH